MNAKFHSALLRPLAALLLAAILALSVLVLPAGAISVPVSSVGAFAAAIASASSGDVLQLDAAFQADLATTAAIGAAGTIAGGDSRNIVVDGGGQTFSPGPGFSGRLFTIVNNGSGTLTFQNMTLQGFASEVFNLSGSGNVVFDNVTFAGNSGGSINSYLSGSLAVKNCVFRDNNGRALNDGQGSVAHSIEIDNSYFFNNKAGNGAAYSLGNNSQTRIRNSTFEQNGNTGATGYAGGAIVADQRSNFTLDIERCYFLDNQIYGNVGGAIGIYRVVNGTFNVKDCVFEGNKSLGTTNICDGGAIAIKNNGGSLYAYTTISGCNFLGNYAGDNGGAFLLEATNGGASSTDVYNCTFNYNVGETNGRYGFGFGGGVQLYGTTNTRFFFNTFYKNGRGKDGGAIGVDVGFPTITNNIFIDNYTRVNNKNQNLYFAGASEDVANNNGNIGYDNGNDFVPGDAARNAEVVAANVFKDFYTAGDPMPSWASAGDAKPVVFDSPVGATSRTADRSCYIITPLTDEMYRTNSRTVYTGIFEDVRGFPRERIIPSDPSFPYYPNAGAVEIYWTKFDPGTGDWNPGFNIAGVLGAIKTLITGSNAYYIVTDPPTGSPPVYSSAYTFPRNTLLGPANHGFVGWEDSITGEIKDVNVLYYSRKQTYEALWRLNQFHVDFDLVGGDAAVPAHFATQVIINGVGGNLATEPLSEPTKPGYVFDGWYADRTYAGVPWNFATDQVLADVTLYAKWIPGTNPPTPTPPVVTPPPGSPEPTPPLPSLPPEPEKTEGGGMLPSFVLPLVEEPTYYTPSATSAPATPGPVLQVRPEEALVEEILVEQVSEAGNEIPVTATKGGIVMLLALAGGGALAVLALRRKARR